jgi:hypothetical protein
LLRINLSHKTPSITTTTIALTLCHSGPRHTL